MQNHDDTHGNVYKMCIRDRAMEAGLGGMEEVSGIPGTIGGAVMMNAGAYGGEMKDIVESVTVLTLSLIHI